MRAIPAVRRPATAIPRAVGTMVAAGHPKSDSRQLSRAPRRAGLTGRHANTPRTRLVPSRAESPPAQGTSTANLHAPAACLSRVPRRVARTVLRGPRRGNAPGLPGDAIEAARAAVRPDLRRGQDRDGNVEPIRALVVAKRSARSIKDQDPEPDPPSELHRPGPAARAAAPNAKRSTPSRPGLPHPDQPAAIQPPASDRRNPAHRAGPDQRRTPTATQGASKDRLDKHRSIGYFTALASTLITYVSPAGAGHRVRRGLTGG